MKRNYDWSRVQKVHKYCDICVNRKKCAVWCYGEKFQQDDTLLVRRSLISRFLSWLKGDSSEKSENI